MSQELENHRDLRPFMLLCNPILFQNDNNPPEIFLMKKIIYVHVENVRVYEFCLSRNISIKKTQKKKQIYYILRYSVKIVLSTHTNSFPFTCPFYDMVSYISNPKSPLPNSLFQETQKKRISNFKKFIEMD